MGEQCGVGCFLTIVLIQSLMPLTLMFCVTLTHIHLEASPFILANVPLLTQNICIVHDLFVVSAAGIGGPEWVEVYSQLTARSWGYSAPHL